MAQPKVGVQLIVYRGRQNQDLAGVLSEVAAAGYAGVETGVMTPNYSMAQVKDVLDRYGLELCGVHASYANYTDPAKVEEIIQYANGLGAKFAMCSGVADRDSLQGYVDSVEVLNRAGRQLSQAGLRLLYHNHAWEFKDFDGQKGIHVLAQGLEPDLVGLCVDVYWVHIGGEAPEDFIARYAQRIPYYHFKDGAPGTFAELGRGEVDLPAAKAAALKTNPAWLVVEQDRSEIDPGEACRISREYLKSLGI